MLVVLAHKFVERYPKIARSPCQDARSLVYFLGVQKQHYQSASGPVRTKTNLREINLWRRRGKILLIIERGKNRCGIWIALFNRFQFSLCHYLLR